MSIVNQETVRMELSIRDDYDRRFREINDKQIRSLNAAQIIADLTPDGKTIPQTCFDFIMSGQGIH